MEPLDNRIGVPSGRRSLAGITGLIADCRTRCNLHRPPIQAGSPSACGQRLVALRWVAA